MSLIGTRVFVKKGSGTSTTIEERNYPALDLLNAVLGEPGSDKIPTEAVVYKCDEKDKCLNPTRTIYSDVNLNNQIYKAMTNYRSSLVYRDVSRVTAEEMTMLATISSLPLLKLAELAASPRMINFSDGMLQTFAQVAAYEAILTAVGQLTEDAKSVVSSSSAKSANSQATEYAQTLVARCDVLRAELLSREKVMSGRVSQVSSLLSYISHLDHPLRTVVDVVQKALTKGADVSSVEFGNH